MWTKTPELELVQSFPLQIFVHTFLLYPRRMKYVEGYIVFVFPSVRPSFRDSVRPSIQVLTFYVKVVREVFSFSYIFKSLYFRPFTYG